MHDQYKIWLDGVIYVRAVLDLCIPRMAVNYANYVHSFYLVLRISGENILDRLGSFAQLAHRTGEVADLTRGTWSGDERGKGR